MPYLIWLYGAQFKLTSKTGSLGLGQLSSRMTWSLLSAAASVSKDSGAISSSLDSSLKVFDLPDDFTVKLGMFRVPDQGIGSAVAHNSVRLLL